MLNHFKKAKLPYEMSVTWTGFPGYLMLVRHLLLEIKFTENYPYSDTIKEASNSLLENENIFNYMVIVLFHKTKLYDGIAIARCEEWKNIEAYLDIVQRNPGYKFMLVSPPVPGKEAYHEKIREMALSLSNLEFYSFVPYYDVYKYFSFSKTIFVTSDLEGDWPLTVIEAAATGLPVLSLNYNYGNLIDEYHAGFFCNGDLNQMNENFLRLMNDEKLLKFMSKNAMAYADVNHNSSKNVLILLKYLNEL